MKAAEQLNGFDAALAELHGEVDTALRVLLDGHGLEADTLRVHLSYGRPSRLLEIRVAIEATPIEATS